MPPKISIIIPIYNVEAYLNRCIDSIIGQTFKDIQLILVDDGSTDKSGDICDEYAKNDKRVLALHKANGGQGIARNFGMEYATGEYITFVDSDDFLDLKTYEVTYNMCIKHNLEVCYFRYCRINERNEISYRLFNPEIEFLLDKASVRQYMLEVFGCFPKDIYNRARSTSACMALFRRKIITENSIVFRSEREIASEDIIFIIDVLDHVEKMAVLPDVFYYYFMRMNSTTTSYSEAKKQRMLLHLNWAHEFLRVRFSEDVYKGHYYAEVLRFFKEAMRHESYMKIGFVEKYKRMINLCNDSLIIPLYKDPIVKQMSLLDRIYLLIMRMRCVLFFKILYKYKGFC